VQPSNGSNVLSALQIRRLERAPFKTSSLKFASYGQRIAGIE
jgi:hypothetical protein